MVWSTNNMNQYSDIVVKEGTFCNVLYVLAAIM
jgi:hypothetical protein